MRMTSMRRSLLAALAVIVLIGVVVVANVGRDPKAVTVDWQIIKPPPQITPISRMPLKSVSAIAANAPAVVRAPMKIP